jgi:hypothetical protein
METDACKAIRSVITPIINQACTDPLKPHKFSYATPHDTHQLAIALYLLDITQPLRHLTDLRTRRLQLNITEATEAHLDPWRCYLWSQQTEPIPPNAIPLTHRHDTNIDAITSTASQDLAEIHMTHINTYIQPQAHREHGKHFTVSLQGALRYNPHTTHKHPHRLTSRDLLDISPDIH